MTDIAIDRNTLYLKQDLIDEHQTSMIAQLLGRKKVFNEVRKEKVMQAMIDLLSEPSFLALFREDGI